MAALERKDVVTDGEVRLAATRTQAANPPDRVPSRVSVSDRITFRGFFRAAIRALIDLDFTSLRTVMELARRPGALILGYIEGDRNRVVNPIKFAVLTSTLYVLVNSLTTTSDVGAMIDPLMSFRGLWPYLSLVLLFPAAALQRLLFRRRQLIAAECYAFGLFVLGEIAFIASVLLTIQRLTSVAVPAWVGLTLAGAYSSWAITGLYQDGRPTVWLRGLTVFGSVVITLAIVLYAFQWYRFAGFG